MTVDTIVAGMQLATRAEADNTDAALERLARWVDAASAASRLVSPLVLTPFVPDAYRPKVDPRASDEDRAKALEVAVASATAAVLYGASLGFDPMTALQQIYIVKGHPGMYAKAKVALLMAHGHQVWTEELDDEHAVVCARRKGSERVERISITMEQARKAGWTSNEAYTKTPQDMLWARAAGRACDRAAPEVMLGIGTVEDLDGFGEPIQTTATVGAAVPALTGSDIIAQAAAAPPAAAPAPAEPERVQTKPSDAELRRLWARMKPHGLHSADLALEWMSQTTGRVVASRDELTRADLAVLGAALDKLDADANQPADAPSAGGIDA